MKAICYLFIIFSLILNHAFAQNLHTVDSLQQVLKTNISDQQKVDVYNLMAKEYRYMDSAQVAKYASKAIELSHKIDYVPGEADAFYYVGFAKLIKGNRAEARQSFQKVLRVSQKADYKKGIANANNGLGVFYWVQSKMDSALIYYKKSLKIRAQIGDKEGTASTSVNIGAIYKYQGKDDKAIELYHQALRIEESIGNTKGMSNCYHNLGMIYTDQGDYPKALKYYQDAIDIRQGIRDTMGLMITYNNMGSTYTRQGKFEKAITFHQQAIVLASAVEDNSNLAANYNNLGIIYNYQGNYPKALEAFHQSLKIREKLKSQSGIAQSFNNIGHIYKVQGDYSSALRYFTQALEKYQQKKYKRGMAISHNNIGIVQELQGLYAKALDHYQQALDLEKQAHLNARITESYLGIGRVYFLQKKYAKAQTFFEEALKMREVMGEKAMSAEAQVNLGMAYYAQKDYGQAQKYLEEGLKAASKTGFILFVKYGAEYLAKVYQATGQPQKALENHILFKQMADSLLNKETIQKIARLETQYVAQKSADSLKQVQAQKDQLMKADLRRREATQKATYIGLGLSALLVVLLFIFYRTQQHHNHKLNRVNAELKQSYNTIQTNAQLIAHQKTDLEQALHQLKELDNFKEKMVGMIAHDLKNPLQAIIGFSQNSHSHPHIPAIHQAAQRMHLLILNMLDTQKFTNTKIPLQKSTQSLPQLVQTATEQVQWFAVAKNIQLEQLISQEIQLSLDAQLISRVLLNLLHNAIKFTPQNGRIAINYEIAPNTQEIKIMVIDNGEGIGIQDQQAIFKPYHQANAHQGSTGLGLAFCKMVVESHQGQIGVETLLGKGSTFWFTLPLSEAALTIPEPAGQHTHNQLQTIELSAEDKAYLMPYINQIKDCKVYHFTKIKTILEQIDVEHHPQVALWKNTLKQAVAIANQQQYEELIDVN
ncbi:hypothetical protein BKI52_33265 [marine bacterium AO1-C]|nr:hypothetical protein BKI52_33265 [marine bacterium AO1-C]